MKLVLASASPRRSDLLTQLGYTFEVRPREVDEASLPDEQARVYVKRMARKKLDASLVHESCAVLAADTVVVLDRRILGKPKSDSEAFEMLMDLSGRTHQVITAIAAGVGEMIVEDAVITDVTFGTIEDEVLAEYVARGEGRDKAGGYGIQGYGAAFVSGLSGSYSGVVGLPLFETSRVLRRFGVIASL